MKVIRRRHLSSAAAFAGPNLLPRFGAKPFDCPSGLFDPVAFVEATLCFLALAAVRLLGAKFSISLESRSCTISRKVESEIPRRRGQRFRDQIRARTFGDGPIPTHGLTRRELERSPRLGLGVQHAIFHAHDCLRKSWRGQ